MAKLKIAVVEDDEILSKVITEELKEAGYEVEQAFDGEAGLALVQKMKPDLVLCDLLMPKKKGMDVLKELKESPATRDIPVMILTMLGRDDDIKQGLQLGANDYIVKSQHAVGEILEKIKDFFAKEAHPEAMRAKAEGANGIEEPKKDVKDMPMSEVGDSVPEEKEPPSSAETTASQGKKQ
jgi:DNA-binding response OmpR family regulator